jgi:hypothetical protein
MIQRRKLVDCIEVGTLSGIQRPEVLRRPTDRLDVFGIRP